MHHHREVEGAELRLEPTASDGTAPRSLLTTIRVPTAYALAQEIQGRQEVTYSCDGMAFWTGEAALAHGGDALRLGPTIQRLDDERQRWFIGAGIVELLRSAGYAPGEHQVALTLAVPNTEIVIIARALRTDRAFAGLIRNDMEAQQALVRQTVTRASRSVSIAAEVQQAVASKGGELRVISGVGAPHRFGW